MKPKKIAIICSVFISLVFISSIIFQLYNKYQINNSDKSYYAAIYQDGVLWERISLQEILQPYTLTVRNTNDSYNIIEVRNNEIGIIESNCPDKTCQNTGFIHDSLIPIVCLPNHLVIQLEPEIIQQPSKTDTEFDAVTY